MKTPVSRVAGLVLAAGRGRRMKSELPKVLHLVAGTSMIEHVLAALKAAGCQRLVGVLSPNLEAFADLRAQHPELSFVVQPEPNGTAGAVAAAAAAFYPKRSGGLFAGKLLQGELDDEQALLVCAGDVPGLDGDILREFVAGAVLRNASVALIGVELDNPAGYGRVLRLRGGSDCLGVVEERDATLEQRALTLCNTGVFYGKVKVIFELLRELAEDPQSLQNAAREYYLTDLFSLAAQRGCPAWIFEAPKAKAHCFLGVNTTSELDRVEAMMLSSSLT